MHLDVNNLEIEISQKTIVRDISLSIKNKEFVGLIGPNGSGKSTILKSLYRVLTPKKGTITLNDKDMLKMSIKSTSKEMAVVSQFNDTNFEFKVLDMVMMGRTPHKKAFELDSKEDFDIAMDCLQKVHMEDYYNRSFSTLSGGEKQRVVLARALAQKSNLIILDEPTNHLDIKHQIEMLDLIKKLDITVLSALHDLNLAAYYCDKLYMIDKGNVVCSGTPNDVLTSDAINKVFGVSSEVSIHPSTNKLNIVFIPN